MLGYRFIPTNSNDLPRNPHKIVGSCTKASPSFLSNCVFENFYCNLIVSCVMMLTRESVHLGTATVAVEGGDVANRTPRHHLLR